MTNELSIDFVILLMLCFILCCGVVFLLLIPLGIWVISSLIHASDPPPKPSAKERWFDIARVYLIVIGIIGTAVSIIGGVILVAVLIVPCAVIYFIMPGPAHTTIPYVPSSSYRSIGSDSSNSYHTDGSSEYDNSYYDRYEDDKRDDHYKSDITDGWLFKYGSRDDDNDDN